MREKIASLALFSLFVVVAGGVVGAPAVVGARVTAVNGGCGIVGDSRGDRALVMIEAVVTPGVNPVAIMRALVTLISIMAITLSVVRVTTTCY